jgi:hypothetical protein
MLRVVGTRGDHIVAGAQVLIRSFPLAEAIGYMPKGSLVAVDESRLATPGDRGSAPDRPSKLHPVSHHAAAQHRRSYR